MAYDQSMPTQRRIISTLEGPSFASLFCDLLASWMEDRDQYDQSWPRKGSFDLEDMAMVEDCTRYYMQQCLAKWERYVEDRLIETQRAKMCLLVQKGTARVLYVPWAQMDKEGLRTKLPSLLDGAGKWITCLKKTLQGLA